MKYKVLLKKYRKFNCQWFAILICKIWLLPIFCIPGIQAQQPDTFKLEISFKPVLGRPSESSITTILQDYQGFMWFGTRNGLNRYDGLQFVVYEHNNENSKSLSNSYVSVLYEDSKQQLWVGTWSGGLNLYDRAHNAFIHFTYDPDDPNSLSNPRVHAIFEDSNHHLWVGTENGLNRYNPETKQFHRYLHDFENPSSLAHNEIRRIIEDKSGNLWIGTYGGGLDRYDPGTDSFVHYTHDPADHHTISNNYIRSAFRDNSGRVWIGTRNGLNGLMADGTYRFERLLHEPENNNSLPNKPVISLSQDENNRLWIGTENGGLSVYDLKQKKFAHFYHTPLDNASIRNNSIWSLYKDNIGTMWVGAYNGGLVTWNRYQSKFRHHYLVPSRSSLNNNNVTCFVEDNLGNLWLGTDGGGLNYFNRGTGKFSYYRHNPDDENSLGSDAVISLMLDSVGNIWVGTWGGGLNCFNPNAKTFIRYQHDENDSTSIGSDNIFTTCIDSQGRFWVGAFYTGLDLFDRSTGKFRHFKPKPNQFSSISDHRVFKILEDSRGNLWVGTQGGGLNLLQWDGHGEPSFAHYRYDPMDATSLGGDVIISLLEDEGGSLWVGTYGQGLSKFDYSRQTFFTYHKSDGLTNEVINGILADNRGDLWMSTNDGLMRFNPDKEVFKQYDVSDGVQAAEFIRGSAYRSKEGELIFGGVNGFNSFFPYEVSENPFIPPVFLTDFRIFNESIQTGPDSPLKENITETKRIVLPYDQNVFSFEIAALNYTQAGKNQYAYKLEGYDKNWQYTGTRRNAYYTQVPPGHYVFRARAANNNGLWNEAGTSVELIVLPPWYRTWWAYVLYGLALIALFQWYRINLIRRERLRNELKLEHIELTKMRELDRIKSNFFANIAHEFRTPLALIQGPLQAINSGNYRGETKRQFRIMLRNSEKLLGLINQLLDLSKLGAGSMKLDAKPQDLIRFLRPIVSSFKSYAHVQQIDFKFHHPEEEVLVRFDTEKLEQVMNNLLSNAFKFTPEHGTVVLTVVVVPNESEGQSWAEIEVLDTGIGIPKELLNNIFNRFYQAQTNEHQEHRGTGIGLSLTKELVELHGGAITVESEVGKGSQFVIKFPIEQARELPKSKEAGNKKEDNTEAQRANLTVSTTENNSVPLILIVEDDEDFRTYVAEHLETNYRLEEAVNGQEAFELAIKCQPDLIISDVMMPAMSGLELSRKIKTDERTSHIPIILITGRASDEHEIEGFEYGADYYIVKPFNSKLLELRVRNILRSREIFRQQLAGDQVFNLEPKQVKLIPADKLFLEKALACIEENMDNAEFTVEAFSQAMAMSRMQLYRKLKALAGQSPNEFIRTIRLKRAAQLIKQQQLTIAEVTYSVGFNDLQYFRDCFKKQFGMSPSSYR